MQLVCWGVTFYQPAIFAPAIARELGWPPSLAFSGLSLALATMALVSPWCGRFIAAEGGRRPMLLGVALNALGCVLLAGGSSKIGYGTAWLVLGVGMRLSLYDAAFAVLTQLAGSGAAPAMQRITLLGGLSSTLFWLLGEWLLQCVGWRLSMLVYASLALLCVPLIMSLPLGGGVQPSMPPATVDSRVRSEGRVQWLYAAGVTLTAFLAAGISTHLPGLLAGLQVPVALAALWGIGQSVARLLDLRWGVGLAAHLLNLWVALALPVCFAVALLAGQSVLLAALFVCAYGAANGLATRVRAALPLMLMTPGEYARRTGVLLAPSFLFAALAPWCFAALRERFGDMATLGASLGIGLLILLMALLMWMRLRRSAI
ncbi:MFS transporter [Pseudomonas sp. CW003PS]|nr:MFS transporter [Pseudomonas sp. CW003PS]